MLHRGLKLGFTFEFHFMRQQLGYVLCDFRVSFGFRSEVDMDLLEEILLEILSKLPVKSLLRFKSVSKSWHSLISDPRLAELNLLHHRSRPREALDVAMYAYIIDAQAWRLRSYKLVGDEITRVGPDPFDTGEIQDDTQIMFCDEQILDGTRIMYCEGLLCFVRFHRFHVCNPTTGEMESLPGIVSDTFYPEDFGFGYDPMRKEYKVVRRRPCNRDGRRVFRFQVFTLGGGGGWRYLVQTIDLVRSVTSVCLDGVIHWISRSKLVTFNVGDECLGEIAVPGVFGKVSPCAGWQTVLGSHQP
ncbi:putative F-box protein [Acorus calamus]|uniref:F-box protein n=1 Tax=Acorus calamus TaxID=4465 RepID=A0AAV9CS00_ACOCL|nr:putative F-box protein [Acorus calamus]